VLAGPDAAAGWLVHGGVLVLDDGSVLQYAAAEVDTPDGSQSLALA
jgi:hypothetical protein